MEFDLETVDRLLSTTRAVRRRLDLTRPVPRELIRSCVDLATRAPSAADAQNWRWVVVTDPERRRAIADARRKGDLDFLGAEVARLGPGAERRTQRLGLLVARGFAVLVVHTAIVPGRAKSHTGRVGITQVRAGEPRGGCCSR